MNIVLLAVIVLLSVLCMYMAGDAYQALDRRHRRARFSMTAMIRVWSLWLVAVGVFLVVEGQGTLAIGPIGLGLILVGGEALARRINAL